MPLNLGEVPDYYRRFLDPVDIAMLKTCPMDEHGYFNFSAANLWHRAIIERAKMVIVEVTASLPYVYGDDNGVHVSEVDYIIEGDTIRRRNCRIRSPRDRPRGGAPHRRRD